MPRRKQRGTSRESRRFKWLHQNNLAAISIGINPNNPAKLNREFCGVALPCLNQATENAEKGGQKPPSAFSVVKNYAVCVVPTRLYSFLMQVKFRIKAALIKSAKEYTAGMNKQSTFSDVEYGGRKRVSRREMILDQMDTVMPWKLIEMIKPKRDPPDL